MSLSIFLDLAISCYFTFLFHGDERCRYCKRTQAFKEFVKVNEKRHSRISVKEKLAEFREQLGKDKNRERAREHQKDRGQSL